MSLFKKRCNHQWKTLADVTYTTTGVGLANMGRKTEERKLTLTCTECGKIKQILVS